MEGNAIILLLLLFFFSTQAKKIRIRGMVNFEEREVSLFGDGIRNLRNRLLIVALRYFKMIIVLISNKFLFAYRVVGLDRIK